MLLAASGCNEDGAARAIKGDRQLPQASESDAEASVDLLTIHPLRGGFFGSGGLSSPLFFLFFGGSSGSSSSLAEILSVSAACWATFSSLGDQSGPEANSSGSSSAPPSCGSSTGRSAAGTNPVSSTGASSGGSSVSGTTEAPSLYRRRAPAASAASPPPRRY